MEMPSLATRSRFACSGLTLTEVVVSLAIGGIVFGGILRGYLQAARRAEWSACHLAAHSLALQQLENVRAAKWDTQAAPPVDRLVAANFPETEDLLDVPVAGTNAVIATTRVSISNVSANPPLKLVRVETVWPFGGRLYTNRIATYRAPDQ